MTTPVHTTDTSTTEAIAKNLAETCRPTVSYVTIQESWQRDYDARLERACTQLPDDVRESVRTILIDSGTMTDPKTSAIELIVKNLKETCLPTGSYGLVYEPWQRDYDANLQRACDALPDDIRFTVMAALIANGTMSDPDASDDLHIPGTCSHGLDADTCPCGCFEG